jgi:DNA helicase-2/ATP-dependent DNA helicase PcrA
VKIRLSTTQEKVVQHDTGAILVVAGPGSGKTRVLTERIRRILSEGSDHFRVLALTFTNKAANEMKERLSEFPDINQRAYIGTLHGFCLEVLASRGKYVGFENLPNIFESAQDRKQVLLDAIAADPTLSTTLKRSGDNKAQGSLVSRWMSMIEEAKSALRAPETLDDPIDAKIYSAYDETLRASGAIDYGDLLLLTYRLFIERPKVADFYRRQFRHICIDEAQDLNEAQYQLLRALCGTEYKNVMMVGDPKQAIYVWNGASPKFMDLFAEDFGAKRIKLNDNFRSSKKVVAAAKSLVNDYEVAGALPIVGAVDLLVGKDEEDEARQILEYLENLVKLGHPDIEGEVTLDRCALIARTRYVFSKIEAELKSRNWEFHTPTTSKLDSESDLLIDFELLLRLLANPRDRLHLGILIKRWKVAASTLVATSSDDGNALIAALGKLAKSESQVVAIKAAKAIEWSSEKLQMITALGIIEEFGAKLADQEERALVVQDVAAWRRHWDFFVRSAPGNNSGLPSFLGQLALGMTQQSNNDGLSLLTVHTSKGLEFDVVVIMGMAEGTFPDYRAKGAALDEESRNAFVAVTRSRRLLALSYSKSRVMPWGDSRLQTPSRYLKQVGVI